MYYAAIWRKPLYTLHALHDTRCRLRSTPWTLHTTKYMYTLHIIRGSLDLRPYTAHRTPRITSSLMHLETSHRAPPTSHLATQGSGLTSHITSPHLAQLTIPHASRLRQHKQCGRSTFNVITTPESPVAKVNLNPCKNMLTIHSLAIQCLEHWRTNSPDTVSLHLITSFLPFHTLARTERLHKRQTWTTGRKSGSS